jgi:Cu/Ag efflux protein CusF
MSHPFARSLVVSFALAAFAAGLSGCAKEPAELPSGIVRENTVSATATVKKVDLKTREVTLIGADGKSFTVKCGDEVRNLPQVKVGDEVTATYYESVAYEVHKPGSVEPGARAAVGAARAEPGEKPGAVAANVVQITATIESIDKSVPSVTLRRADGELVLVKVRDPKKLDAVSVGDMVEITFTEAVAISVEASAK